jgi:hypothetical protein
MLLPNFPINNIPDEDIQKKKIAEGIRTYNANFSTHPRTVNTMKKYNKLLVVANYSRCPLSF